MDHIPDEEMPAVAKASPALGKARSATFKRTLAGVVDSLTKPAKTEPR